MRWRGKASGDQSSGRSRWFPWMTGVLLLMAIAVIALELIPANAYVLLPGHATAVVPMISIQGQPPASTTGNLYMTDVSYYKANHLLEQLYGQLNPNADVVNVQDFSGGLSQSQYVRFNVNLMNTSIEEAEAAALSVVRHYRPKYTNYGPEVLFTLPHTPAEAALRPGDILKVVDGHNVKTRTDVTPLIRSVRPGGLVHLVILRNGIRRPISLRTIAATAGKPDPHGKQSLIGIDMQDRLKLRLPLKISINVGNVGGPSAGLMFTLGIVQRLQQRDLTHGCKVAGTGTISIDGKVGPIGGAKQKIAAARDAGAKYFLVPDVPENRGPAQANRGNVTVVPVRTLRQALAFLHGIRPCK